MTKHFCDICGNELTEANMSKHDISFKYVDNDRTATYTEFCSMCAENLAMTLINMLDKNKKCI